ncbi:Stealth-like protein [Sediminihabitans luteus]|uniref:Stealth-like protein n=1 Tax=Sediminihabitans luteus TaxID=1138585 RepID=A0A2M9CDM9_9CELL|nr:stealth family protein [Sediminihabitans luteus]PJJ70003.1 Stealth-like protein [Sediminihabitans luteus]GII99324.1 exopolysaccharide phosphotransferase [Sediminihabitans luteus]
MGIRDRVAAHLSVRQRLVLSQLLHGELPWQRGPRRRPVDPADPAPLVDAWRWRDETFALVVGALDGAGVELVVLPDGAGPDRVVVVRVQDHEATVAALDGLPGTWDRRDVGRARGRDHAPVALEIGRPVPTGPGLALRFPHLGVRIEFWDVVGDEGRRRVDGGTFAVGTVCARVPGKHVPYLAPERWAEAVAAPGHVPPPLRAPHLLSVHEPIDVVYTWVDGDDPRWQERKAEAQRAVCGDSVHETAVSSSRYVARDELRYSMRSVEAYAGWVNRIVVVSDGQVPAWLDRTNERVVVVDHREIFSDPGVLPVFNSHAIESQLHHVPGLSDRYLYLNDDVFFGRPVRPELFFLGNGGTKFFLSDLVLDLDAPTVRDFPVLAAAKNNRDLVHARTGRIVTNKFKHTPHPQDRAVLERLEREHPEVFAAVAASRFRHPGDLSIASSLHHHVAFAEGHAVPGTISYAYQDTSRPDAVLLLNELLRRRDVDVFCLNDVTGGKDSVATDRMMLDFLRRYYPRPSSFERDVTPR